MDRQNSSLNSDDQDQPTILEDRSASQSGPAEPLPLSVLRPGETVPLTRLGEYELLHELGRGGMGVVFKARHVRLQRTVALKMILGGALAQQEYLQRFETEASAAAQLQHSGIVGVYEVGCTENQPFISMEFIEGKNLAQLVAEGTLPGKRVARILEATARAVHFAHTRGVIHRDLKPANVLVAEDDQPKVTDFGLAKLLSTDSDHTRTGAVLGTPSYMSPEQAGAEKVGPSADVYSLGAILYEMLTGRPPFRGESALATLQMVREQDPVSPRMLNPGVDRDLETICLKCLEKVPARRYATALALAEDLRRYRGNEPIAARPVGPITRAMKWCRRRPARAALLAGSIVLTLGAIIFEALVAQEQYELRKKAEEAEQLAHLRQESMRHLLYLAEMRRAKHALEMADFERAERLLKRWLPRQPLKDLRHWEWNFLTERSRGKYFLEGHQGPAQALAYFPDGKFLASAGGPTGKPGEIILWDLETGTKLKTIPAHQNTITSLAFQADGKVLASAGFDRIIRLWNPETGQLLATLSGHTAHVNQLAFSPQENRLASAGGDRTLRIWEVDRILRGNPPQPRIVPGHQGEVLAVAFHPEGHTLASAGQDGVIRLLESPSGRELKRLTGHQGEIEALAFSHQGKILASGGGKGSRRGELKLWDAVQGKLLTTHYGLSDKVRSLAFNREGKLAAGTADGLVRIWDQSISSEPFLFRADPQQIQGLAFAPTGLHLATAGRNGRICLWSSTGGLETTNVPVPGNCENLAFSTNNQWLAGVGRFGLNAWPLEHGPKPIAWPSQGRLHAVAFSPDNDRIACAGEDKWIRIYSVNNPTREPMILKGHGLPIRGLAYSSDGRWLASASEDDTIRLWHADSGKLDRVLMGHANGVLTVAFSPNSQWLVSGSFDKTLRVWDLNTGESFALAGHTGSVNTVVFDPTGRQAASGSQDRTIRLWDLQERKEFFRLEGSPSPVLSLAFHPHNLRLASASQDNSVRLWDLVTRQEILEMEGAILSLGPVRFSPNGQLLAAGGANAVRIWEGKQP